MSKILMATPTPNDREQALVLLALALVSLSNSIGPQIAVAKRYQKQFIDHLVSHGIERVRARELHILLSEAQDVAQTSSDVSEAQPTFS